MSITYRVYNFPTFPISKQLFHVPGAAVDGGFTSGGARITSPEPGGFAMLEIEPSLVIGEWQYPLASWLMSKTNGQILRVRLAPTPQIASAASAAVPWGAETIYPDSPWSNEELWAGDIPAVFNAVALEGSNRLSIDMSAIGPILQPGHVIGHEFSTYKIDEITYDSGGIATIDIFAALRKNVAVGDMAYLRPWFTGQIINPGDFRNTYDAENAGNIQLGKIILGEVVV